jgi:hypothetical protein
MLPAPQGAEGQLPPDADRDDTATPAIASASTEVTPAPELQRTPEGQPEASTPPATGQRTFAATPADGSDEPLNEIQQRLRSLRSRKRDAVGSPSVSVAAQVPALAGPAPADSLQSAVRGGPVSYTEEELASMPPWKREFVLRRLSKRRSRPELTNGAP